MGTAELFFGLALSLSVSMTSSLLSVSRLGWVKVMAPLPGETFSIDSMLRKWPICVGAIAPLYPDRLFISRMSGVTIISSQLGVRTYFFLSIYLVARACLAEFWPGVV